MLTMFCFCTVSFPILFCQTVNFFSAKPTISVLPSYIPPGNANGITLKTTLINYLWRQLYIKMDKMDKAFS